MRLTRVQSVRTLRRRRTVSLAASRREEADPAAHGGKRHPRHFSAERLCAPWSEKQSCPTARDVSGSRRTQPNPAGCWVSPTHAVSEVTCPETRLIRTSLSPARLVPLNVP